MNTAVETVGYVTSAGDNPETLYVMRASLAPDALSAAENGDDTLKHLLASAALISAEYPYQDHTAPVRYVDLVNSRHLIAVGHDPLPQEGRGILGFAIREVDRARGTIRIPELSLSRSAFSNPALYHAIGHAIFDGILSDVTEEENAYKVMAKVHRTTGPGRQVLLLGRGFLRSSAEASTYGSTVGRLRAGAQQLVPYASDGATRG